MEADYRTGSLAVVLLAAVLAAWTIASGGAGMDWPLVGRIVGLASLSIAIAYAIELLRDLVAGE